MRTTQIVEAVLFSSDAPLRSEEIARADESLNEDVVEKCIKELTKMYLDSERAFEIKQIAGGYQILTLSVYAPYLERFDTVPKSSRLSMPALETLAIIAYRQPIGRIDIEYIRGVSSAGVIRTLQDRELVDVIGRGDGLGRPLLYGTTNKFLEHFGFSDLEDLPQTEDLPVILKGEDIPDSVGSVISGELETKNNEEIMTTEQEIDDLTDGGGVVPLTSPVE
jgi:segregation and condensation protein B